MHPLRLAAVALQTTPLDWEGNARRLRAALAAARAAGAHLVCCPEMCLSGYGCEDAFHGADVARQALRSLRELLPETKGLVATFGLPVPFHRALFNCVAVVADGRVLGLAAKRHLAGDGIHYEPRWFKAWNSGEVATLELDGIGPAPIGDLLFEIGGVRLGLEICEDAWVANRPGARLAGFGAEVILNPSASHFAFGKKATRHLFVAEGSRAFGAAYVYANLLGNESGRTLYDGHAMVAAGGRVVAESPRLTCRDFELAVAEVDLAAARTAQARSASFRPALGEHPGLVRAAHAWPAPAAPRPAAAAPPAWESSPRLKEEEFTRAEALALFDYLRKSRAQGFVVSLSGGVDSAAVASLVALMVARGVEDLGLSGFKAALGHVKGLDACADPKACVGRLLTTIYQGTENSSDTTRDAASQVAAALGAKHLAWDVGPLVAAYTRMVAEATGRAPDWKSDDLALQNIQARVRSPGAWLVTNLEDKLLLATSNRTEAAVGYCTMDGDTSGGISPIAGVDKAFLRRWLLWLEKEGPAGLAPIPALACVNAQASTPELRPPDAAQKSEQDLMPFPVLDRLERLFILDKLPPREVLERLAAEHPQVARAELERWVTRFFQLWSRNQWKRERLAPAFHLDDENLDPKSWCRFPILSAGFGRELGEMRGDK